MSYEVKCKFLGPYIDKDLKFREHIEQFVRKLQTYCVRKLYREKGSLLLDKLLCENRHHVWFSNIW